MNNTDGAFSSLQIIDFRRYIWARFLLSLGFQMQSTIVGWQVYEYTHDALSLGLTGLAEALPFIAIALLGGYVADRFNRKIIIILSTLFLLLSSLGLLYIGLNIEIISKHGVIPIYLMVVIGGLSRGFIGSSYFAFMSQLVPRNLLANSSTWNSTIWHIAAVAGPALAGLLYAWYGAIFSYSLICFLIFSSILFIILIPSRPLPPPNKKETIIESLSVGLKFVFTNQVVLGALSLDLFAVLFGGAVALLPIFADQILHVGAQGLGILRAAPAMGAVVAAIIMAYIPPTKNAGRNLLWAVVAFGLCMIIFAFSKSFVLTIFVLAISGGVDNISVVIRHTILQLMTPDEMRGRVASVNSIFIGSSNEIGAFESGVAAKFLGLIPSVVFGGVMTLGVVGIIKKLAPKLSKLNLESIK